MRVSSLVTHLMAGLCGEKYFLITLNAYVLVDYMYLKKWRCFPAWIYPLSGVYIVEVLDINELTPAGSIMTLNNLCYGRAAFVSVGMILM